MNIITSNRSKRFRITNTTKEKTKLFASDRMVYIHWVPQFKKSYIREINALVLTIVRGVSNQSSYSYADL